MLLLLLSPSVVFDSVRPHRWQPTCLLCPWDSPGWNTGVGCHFLLQCMHACMLNRFSHVRLCVTPWTAVHQAPLSMEFSRQEYWSGLPFPFPRYIYICDYIYICIHIFASMFVYLSSQFCSWYIGSFEGRVLTSFRETIISIAIILISWLKNGPVFLMTPFVTGRWVFFSCSFSLENVASLRAPSLCRDLTSCPLQSVFQGPSSVWWLAVTSHISRFVCGLVPSRNLTPKFP